MSTEKSKWLPTYIFPREYLVSNDGKVKSVRTRNNNGYE